MPLALTAFDASLFTLGLLAPARGGTGADNGAHILTVPATGTAALLGVSNTFTQAIEDAATPSGDTSLVNRLYVVSREENLITNGSGLIGTNYNFSGFSFDATETHGGGGSFKHAIGGTTTYTEIFSDEFLPVDPQKFYRLVAWAMAGDTGGGNFDPGNKQYLGIAAYDIDQLIIYPAFVLKFSGSTDTTLSAALNTNDTTMSLTNAAGWQNGSAAGDNYTRNMAWWPYTNGKGYTYSNYTYTRNISWNLDNYLTNGMWAGGGISGNTVTLTSAWPGPSLPAGTAVRNLGVGATYKYIVLSNVTVPNAWTRYEGFIGSYDTAGAGTTNLFPYGTAFIKLLFLPNIDPTINNNVRFSDIWFSENQIRNLLTIKAGVPTDSDWSDNPPDGTMVVDSADNRLYIRVGGAWKYAALT